MAAIPTWLLRHPAIIEPYQGNSPSGPVYGLPVHIRCFAEDQRRLVRDDQGTEIISETTLYCPLSTVAPAESRVTVAGRVSTVIVARRRDGAGLPTPDHLEVSVR
ncbi:MAG TPA: hypothetical protein VFC19_49550 [Candidatus Limnocylindrales bacterium]|nr:hypothetical protein [Candidatus Limnocylindrales bacterium]